MWNTFWDWYEKNLTKSLLVTAFIIYIQIPHMIWNADLYLQLGVITHIHPVLDFLLYGVDLIEVLPMINLGLIIYSRVRSNSHNESKN